MHLLLPPSETKRPGGGSVFSGSHLSRAAELGAAREAVRSALIELSGDEAAAAKALKLGTKNLSEREHNLRLDSSGAMPALERYTGVLYDALDAVSLDPDARAWASAHVSVQSALFGLVGADDLIPAYRLSASSRLPQLGAPLKRVWSAAHSSIDWSSYGWILDLRSKDYAALAPLPGGSNSAWLHVAQRGPGGEVRALNHFNKAAKGDLVRRMAESGAECEGPDVFVEWARANGLEASFDVERGEVTLVTALGAPALV